MGKSPKRTLDGRAKNGGVRPGAGRPKGAKNPLPLGTVAAVKSLRWRVPDGTPTEIAAVADRAFDRVVAVMDEKVNPFAAHAILKSAAMVREEVCGPVEQKVAVTGKLTLEQLVMQSFETPTEEET